MTAQLAQLEAELRSSLLSFATAARACSEPEFVFTYAQNEFGL